MIDGLLCLAPNESGGDSMITRFLGARFGRRLILWMLLATIPAMLGGTWILSRKATDDLMAAGVQRLSSTADNLANRVDGWVGDVARDLQLLSRHPSLTGMNSCNITGCFSNFAGSTRKSPMRTRSAPMGSTSPAPMAGR